jgi:iron complex transport system permease protein
MGDLRRRRQLVMGLLVAGAVLAPAGLAIGSTGFGWPQGDAGGTILFEIRMPRTLGAFFVGALLGLAGALAQGLFRNPLAEPYLIGAEAGSVLAVVLVLAAVGAGGHAIVLASAALFERLGLAGAAFAGAFGGVMLAVLLAGGAAHTLRLLLAGIVVGLVLGAATELVTMNSTAALRGKQAFLLGSTGLVGWGAVVLLAAGLAAVLAVALPSSRVLDALTLGEDTAASLGLDLPRWRLVLLAAMALATGVAVSQAGLIAFIGLAAPHLVRRFAPSDHRFLLAASALAGGTLLLAADVLARAALAPAELPVGIVTALLGGSYLLWLLRRPGAGYGSGAAGGRAGW